MSQLCIKCDLRPATGGRCGYCGGCFLGFPCWSAEYCRKCLDDYEPSDSELQALAERTWPSEQEWAALEQARKAR
jgi:hypothetical protein